MTYIRMAPILISERLLTTWCKCLERIWRCGLLEEGVSLRAGFEVSKDLHPSQHCFLSLSPPSPFFASNLWINA